MKNDAVLLVNKLIEFKEKYELRSVYIDAFAIDQYLSMHGDKNENGDFNVYRIYADGRTEEVVNKNE
jgi:hypothetical protein